MAMANDLPRPNHNPFSIAFFFEDFGVASYLFDLSAFTMPYCLGPSPTE